MFYASPPLASWATSCPTLAKILSATISTISMSELIWRGRPFLPSFLIRSNFPFLIKMVLSKKFDFSDEKYRWNAETKLNAYGAVRAKLWQAHPPTRIYHHSASPLQRARWWGKFLEKIESSISSFSSSGSFQQATVSSSTSNGTIKCARMEVVSRYQIF